MCAFRNEVCHAEMRDTCIVCFRQGISRSLVPLHDRSLAVKKMSSFAHSSLITNKHLETKQISSWSLLLGRF